MILKGYFCTFKIMKNVDIKYNFSLLFLLLESISNFNTPLCSGSINQFFRADAGSYDCEVEIDRTVAVSIQHWLDIHVPPSGKYIYLMKCWSIHPALAGHTCAPLR